MAKEMHVMNSTMWGVVKGGLIIPQSPLPEGARVQILVPSETTELPPDLQTEFNSWCLGSTEALAAFEQQLDVDAGHAQG
jgi:hypothetical protein